MQVAGHGMFRLQVGIRVTLDGYHKPQTAALSLPMRYSSRHRKLSYNIRLRGVRLSFFEAPSLAYLCLTSKYGAVTVQQGASLSCRLQSELEGKHTKLEQLPNHHPFFRCLHPPRIAPEVAWQRCQHRASSLHLFHLTRSVEPLGTSRS